MGRLIEVPSFSRPRPCRVLIVCDPRCLGALLRGAVDDQGTAVPWGGLRLSIFRQVRALTMTLCRTARPPLPRHRAEFRFFVW